VPTDLIRWPPDRALALGLGAPNDGVRELETSLGAGAETGVRASVSGLRAAYKAAAALRGPGKRQPDPDAPDTRRLTDHRPAGHGPSGRPAANAAISARPGR
jgi:hypothetical protein